MSAEAWVQLRRLAEAALKHWETRSQNNAKPGYDGSYDIREFHRANHEIASIIYDERIAGRAESGPLKFLHKLTERAFWVIARHDFKRRISKTDEKLISVQFVEIQYTICQAIIDLDPTQNATNRAEVQP